MLTTERSDNVSSLFTLITNMLSEVNKLDMVFLSISTRKNIASEIVNDNENISVRDLLMNGCRGLNEYTDHELLEDYMTRHCTGLYEDFEFEGTIWHSIEQDLLRLQTILINQAVDKHIL